MKGSWGILKAETHLYKAAPSKMRRENRFILIDLVSLNVLVAAAGVQGKEYYCLCEGVNTIIHPRY